MIDDVVFELESDAICITDSCPEAADWWRNVTTSNFTCSQLLEYCDRYTYSVYLTDLMASISIYSFAIGGLIGLISNSLMIAVMKYVPFNVSSRIYHISLAVAETLHMMAMSNAGIIQLTNYRNSDSYSFVVWSELFSNGWQIGDPMKLTVSALTVCIAVERCVAGSFPFVYRKINSRCSATALTVFCFALGMLNMYQLYLGYVERLADGTYRMVLDKHSRPYEAFVQTVTVLKVTFSLMVLVSCLILLYGLRMHSKRIIVVGAAGGGGQSNREQRQSRRLSIFCLWTSAIMIFDHISWAIYKVQTILPAVPAGADAVASLTFRQAMQGAQQSVDFAWARVVQALGGVLAHCGRFFIYYIVHKSYRNALAYVICRKPASISNNVASKSVGQQS